MPSRGSLNFWAKQSKPSKIWPNLLLHFSPLPSALNSSPYAVNRLGYLLLSSAHTALFEPWPCSSCSPCLECPCPYLPESNAQLIYPPSLKISSPLNSVSCVCTFHFSFIYLIYNGYLPYQIVKSWSKILFVYIFEASIHVWWISERKCKAFNFRIFSKVRIIYLR